jgi:acetyl-CoA acetyltransferase
VSETTEIVLVDAARTPHGTVLGLLADRSAVDFGTVALDGRLDRSGIAVDDVDHSEGNEAFAAQTVYVRDGLDLPADRSNPSGGAIAFGHPIGASGGMLATSLLYAMERENAPTGGRLDHWRWRCNHGVARTPTASQPGELSGSAPRGRV